MLLSELRADSANLKSLAAMARSMTPVRTAGERDKSGLVEGKMGERDERVAAVRAIAIGLGRELDEIGVAGRVLGEECHAAMIYMPSQLPVFRLGLGLGAKLSDKVQPTIGWMRAWAKLSENSSAPNRLLVSVSASAGMRCSAASVTRCGMVSAPSSSE